MRPAVEARSFSHWATRAVPHMPGVGCVLYVVCVVCAACVHMVCAVCGFRAIHMTKSALSVRVCESCPAHRKAPWVTDQGGEVPPSRGPESLETMAPPASRLSPG